MVLSTGAARASTLSGSSIARVQGAEIAARSCGARVRGSTHWSGFKTSRHVGDGIEGNFKIQKGGWRVPRAQDPTRTRCSNALIGSTADYPQVRRKNPEASMWAMDLRLAFWRCSIPVSRKVDVEPRSCGVARVPTTASASVLLMSTFIGPAQTSDIREGSNREFEKSKRGVPPSDLLGGSIVYTTGAASPAGAVSAREWLRRRAFLSKLRSFGRFS